MYVDRGLDDRLTATDTPRQTGDGEYTVVVREPLGKHWPRELVTCDLPAGDGVGSATVTVTLGDQPVACQLMSGGIAFVVEDLRPFECHTYQVRLNAGPAGPAAATPVRFTATSTEVVFENEMIGLRLPPSRSGGRPSTEAVPGPILAVRRAGGDWLGRGRLADVPLVSTVDTRLVESGPLWSAAEVMYRFADGTHYCARIVLRAGDDAAEVREDSSLPVRLWPAPRPYREIGTLDKSFWNQSPADLAKPCIRPCPRSRFLFDVRPGLEPDFLVTHSTSSWEIMHLPLGSPAPKTYTAMRPAVPFIDGGWLGLYASGGNTLLGVVSIDIVNWRIPDDTLHPAHRMPGASAEVLLEDSRAEGSVLRFPIENIARRWLLAVLPNPHRAAAADAPAGKPFRQDADPAHPLWASRIRRGDLRLNKVKHWIVDWPDAGHEHPRLLCRRADFAAIRRKVQDVPELRRNRDATLHLHATDRYLLNDEPAGLQAIEDATHATELIENILARGYTGPIYAIGLARPLRRYAMACDVMWDSFTDEEKRRVRRTCALAAYILTDGDWWQYAFRDGETTYLPNFNTDVFTCAGMIGMFLSDHPCSAAWTGYLVERLDLELEQHLRLDGGGEENVGAYLLATWKQLYLPTLWALRHVGAKDYSRDPRILAGGRFLLKALGPPDARDGGQRMIPPIGHHPNARKDLALCAWLAPFIRESAPRLAENLQWAWRVTGAVVDRNKDHSGPLGNPLTRHYILHDPSIPETPPLLESYALPHVGAVLRSHDASGRGSYLFLKAGRVHSHHDDDEGSFHYFGRGVPLAQDGLPLQNGATAEQHNAVTFGRRGQPSGLVEAFATTPAADYVRARIAPRAYACDAMYVDGWHRSGFTRELLLVKAPEPGGVEYLVVKDTTTGPDACQWNLDVLSTRPEQAEPGRVWFPGHPRLGMGMDLFLVEPCNAPIAFEPGVVNPQATAAPGTPGVSDHQIRWAETEHWLLHAAAEPGATFLAVLYPRASSEPLPQVEYLEREETLVITHQEGRDIIFLRPNPMVGVSLDGVVFRGRAGLVHERSTQRQLCALDAVAMGPVGS